MYLDTSCVLALVVEDLHRARATALVASFDRTGVVTSTSEWTAAELAARLGVRVRQGKLAREAAIGAFTDFSEAGLGRDLVAVSPDDVRRASRTLSRFELNLRAPDALHLAIVERIGTPLATFDNGMADAARALGIEVVDA